MSCYLVVINSTMSPLTCQSVNFNTGLTVLKLKPSVDSLLPENRTLTEELRQLKSKHEGLLFVSMVRGDFYSNVIDPIHINTSWSVPGNHNADPS